MAGLIQGAGDAFVQVLSDSAQEPIERTDRPAEPRGHVFEGQFLVIAQLDDIAMVGGQLCEAFVQQVLAVFEAIGALFGFIGNGTEKILAEIQPVALSALPMREHLMERDLARPSAEIGAGLKFRKVPPHYNFGLLQDIIGILRMRHHRHYVSTEEPLVAGEQEDEFFGAVGRRHE